MGVFAIRERSFGIAFVICAQKLDAGKGRDYSSSIAKRSSSLQKQVPDRRILARISSGNRGNPEISVAKDRQSRNSDCEPEVSIRKGLVRLLQQ